MIGIASSTYYYRPKISRAEREEADAALRDEIERVRTRHPNTGYRMLQHYLARRRFIVGERRLRRVLKKYSLHAKIQRAFKRTTDSNHSYRVYPNRLKGLELSYVNQAWGADLTYIRIANGFVYLAIILDLFSRRVVGWAVSKHIDADLAVSALKMAITRRQPPKGCLHHSDRGSQYLCEQYIGCLEEHGFEISNSAKGNPYHNATVESLIKTLKQEEVYLANYETYLDVIENLPLFIEEVYNEKRIHSSLGYLTPIEFENQQSASQVDSGPAAKPL